MSRRIRVAPGKLSRSAAGFATVVAILFLVFGVIFFSVVISDTPSSEEGLQWLQAAFLAIWTVACLGIAFVNLRIFLKAKNPADAALLELVEDVGKDGVADAAFDVRLRKLEALRRDGLITEDEYRQKRTQLLEEKW